VEVDPSRGVRIREVRERAGRTQLATADAVGVSERAYQSWEAGGKIAYPNLVALARVLDVDLDAILNEPGTEIPAQTVEQRVDRIEGNLLRIVRTELSALREFVQEAAETAVTGLEELRGVVAGQTAAVEALASQMAALRAELRSAAESRVQSEAAERPPRRRRASGNP